MDWYVCVSYASDLDLLREHLNFSKHFLQLTFAFHLKEEDRKDYR